MPRARRQSPLPAVADAAASGGRRSERRRLQDRRELDRALRESEQRLRAALEASLDATFLMASVRDRRGQIVDFRFLEANQRALERVGRSRAEFIGSRFCQMFPTVARDGFLARYIHVVDTGEPAAGEFYFDLPGFTPRWLHYQAVKLGDGIALSSHDITERKRSEAALREVPQRVYAATEAERRRVARELHDGASQLLSAACLRLHALAASLTGHPASASAAAQISRMVQHARDEVRRISQGLRPSELDDLGLVPALRSLVAEFAERTHTRVTLRLPRTRLMLSPENQLVVYRLTQEALHNVERHARASLVEVELRQKRRLAWLRIADNGRGFSLTRKRSGAGHGLFNMRERVAFAEGEFQLKSSPRGGTEIVVQLPLLAATASSSPSDSAHG